MLSKTHKHDAEIGLRHRPVERHAQGIRQGLGGFLPVVRLDALPATPATVGTYLAAHAGQLAVSTLTRRLSEISTLHRLAGYRLDTRDPAIHDLLRGIRQRRVAPATTSIVQAMVATCGPSLAGLRDRALTGWFRRRPAARRTGRARCRRRGRGHADHRAPVENRSGGDGTPVSMLPLSILSWQEAMVFVHSG